MNLFTLIKISRPRFWLYTVGTFAVGAVAGASSIYDLFDLKTAIYLIYFAFFSNIFIYGINDLFDEDTDQFNKKKSDKEHLLKIQERKSLISWVVASLLIGVVLAWNSPDNLTMFLWFLHLFLAGAYSASPFRFKAKPFIDAASNIHYALVGFIAYSLYSLQAPPFWAVMAAWFWTASMHIFSAIPDIKADAKAKLVTTAVFFGSKKSLYLCSALWLGTSFSLWLGGWTSFWPLVTLIYVTIPLLLINSKENVINKVYWYFPIINGVVGFLLFWTIALAKIY